MSKKGNYKIPFEASGKLMDYASGDSYYDFDQSKNLPIIWEDNYQFHDTLEYTGYSQGRSACHIYLKSVNNSREYHVTIKDFDLIIKKNKFNNNRIEGDFTFAKRGSNYMLVPVFPVEQPVP